MSKTSDAEALACGLLEPLGRRWVHVRAVAERARQLVAAVQPGSADVLMMAAWLHDIGYAPAIARTGFHPLDGARYLQAEGWGSAVVNLVAQHSGARFEAAERGLCGELAEFPFEENDLSDALAAADLTTGPDGQTMTYNERIHEILRRYPAASPVHRAWILGRGEVERSVSRALAAAQSTTG